MPEFGIWSAMTRHRFGFENGLILLNSFHLTNGLTMGKPRVNLVAYTQCCRIIN
jgi:hypothetical protein